MTLTTEETEGLIAHTIAGKTMVGCEKLRDVVHERLSAHAWSTAIEGKWISAMR